MEQRKYDRHEYDCTGVAILPGEMQKIVVKDISLNGIAFSFCHPTKTCGEGDVLKLFFYDRGSSQLCSLDCKIARTFSEGQYLAIGGTFEAEQKTIKKVIDILKNGGAE
ncbi:MAG: PilZ domain-containing protein [Lachnospiraceae bacterium]|nr:PilZ domain-containing protein [Lachnospiraceae bacterium]